MPDRTEQIQDIARRWLTEGVVEAVVGWGRGTYRDRTAPVLIRGPEEINRLLFNERCVNNLVTYLKREPVYSMKKVGIVAKGCDIKTLIGLIQESQVERDKVMILAVTCPGVKKDDGTVPIKCQTCQVNTPTLFDEIAGENVASNSEQEAQWKELERLDSMSPHERFLFWKEQFSKCIRCYACRQACPLCICNRCIAEKNQPQWIDASPHLRGNFAWNLIRAHHLAGRCVECEACETACPANIPLMLLNRSLARTVKNAFSYEAGKDPESAPPLRTFRQEDDESFIL